MPAGMQIFDEGGHVLLDSTKATGLVINFIEVQGTEVKTVVNDEFTRSRPMFLVMAFNANARRDRPHITVTGNTMRIEGTDHKNANGVYRVFYGVY